MKQFGWERGVEHFDALGMNAGKDEEGFTHTLVKLLFFGIETGLLLAQSTRVIGGIGASLYQSRVEVGQDGQGGNMSLGGDHREARDKLYADAGSMALIRDTGVHAALGA